MDSDSRLFLSDRPIKSEQEDEFGHQEYVDSLERILKNAEPPWHIGIFGQWGTGKTSVIRLLFDRIRDSNEFQNTICVEFDAWGHAEGSIRTELLLELDRRIGQEKGNDKGVLGEDKITELLYDVKEEEKPVSPSGRERITEFVSQNPIISFSLVALSLLSAGFALAGMMNIAAFAATALVFPIFNHLVKQFDKVTKTVQRRYMHPRKEWSGAYQRIFEDIVEEAEAEKIIISIDNLDRCESETVYDVLVSLKTFMENDKCIYLIPCDDKALESHISSIDEGKYFENSSNEPEFLRKFFQAHIRIPPVIPKDIENYADTLNQELEEPFGDETIDVLTSAYIDNPRQIKHAINRLSTLRILAEEKEEAGNLNSGRITEDMPFLAKISILEDEHREFYEAIAKDSYLLEDVNKYFDNELQSGTRKERVEEYLNTNGSGVESRLETFLRSTRIFSVDEATPFLTLSEPAYATSIDNVDEFVNNLRASKADEVRSELEKLSDSEVPFDDYYDALRESLGRYQRSGRTQPLFATIDTTIQVFDVLEEEPRKQVANLLGGILTTREGREFLDKLDARVTFEVIIRVSNRNHRVSLFSECAKLVEENENLNSRALQAFVDYADQIPRGSVRVLSQSLEGLQPPSFKDALDQIGESDSAKENLLVESILNKAVRLAELQDREHEFENTDYYTRFDELASKKTRSSFVTHILELRDDYSGNQQDQINRKVSELLLSIQSEITSKTGADLFESIQSWVKSQNNNRTELVEVSFHFYSSFSSGTRDDFSEWVATLFSNWHVKHVREIIGFGETYDVPLFKTEQEVKSILGRIPGHFDDADYISENIVEKTAPEHYDQVRSQVMALLKNNDLNHTRLGVNLLKQHSEMFSEMHTEILDQCERQVKRNNNYNEKRAYFGLGADLFSEFDGANQEKYLGQLDQHLSANAHDYKIYKEAWDKIEPEISDDQRETVARNVREELEERLGAGQNPDHLTPLVDILCSLSGYMSEDEGRQFIERLSKRLNENINENQKATVLDQLAKFDKFYGKEDQVLDRLKSVVQRSNRNNLNQSAEKLLKKLELANGGVSKRVEEIREEHLS